MASAALHRAVVERWTADTGPSQLASLDACLHPAAVGLGVMGLGPYYTSIRYTTLLLSHNSASSDALLLGVGGG